MALVANLRITLHLRLKNNNKNTMNIEKHTQDYYATSNERSYQHPVIQAFSAPKYQWIKQHLALDNKTVLDVASGNGYFAQHFEKDCQLTALDLSSNQLQYNPASHKKVGSAYELPFADNSFDVVFTSNLLHHLENPAKAIGEMQRVSKRYVVISEPNRNNPMIFLGALCIPHERGAIYSSRKNLSAMIKQQGLRITHHTFLGGFVMPNGTPTFMLPLAMATTQAPFSFFQIFICEK